MCLSSITCKTNTIPVEWHSICCCLPDVSKLRSVNMGLSAFSRIRRVTGWHSTSWSNSFHHQNYIQLGSDAAFRTTKVVLSADHPSSIADIISISKRARSTICKISSFHLGLKSISFPSAHLTWYTLVAGYSQRITPNSIIIFDFYREREREENADVNVLEAGTRTQLDPLTVLSIGGGIGIRQDSLQFQVTIGVQRSLSGQFFFF